LQEKTKYICECDDNIRSLNQKVDLLERKNSDMSEKFSVDKKSSKKLLNELKDAIEALKWSAEENDKSKSHEIEKLKLEVANFKRDKDESMELQRHDMISTFDSIISQKDAALVTKEKDVMDQVITLESRLEALLNENVKLKSSIADAKRICDHLREDNLSRQDSIRQLQWKLEDEIKGKAVLEDRLNGLLQNSKAENESLKESSLKADFAHKLSQEKICNEVDRLKDSYQSQIEVFGEYKKSSMSNTSRLELELLESQNREDRLRTELSNCLISKDIENEKAVSLKSHLDLVVSRFSILEKENASYHYDNNQLKRQLNESKDMLEAKLREANNVADERLRLSQIEFSKSLSTIQQVAIENNSNLESFRQSEYERINAIVAAEYGTKLKQMEESKQIQNEANMSSLKAELDRLNQHLLLKNKEIEDEKAETAAVKLRLKLYEKNHSAAAQPNSMIFASQMHLRQRVASNDDDEDDKKTRLPNAANNSNDNIMGSPMFSDDFGSVSIPNSPMVSFMNDKDNSFLYGKEAFNNSPNDRNPSHHKLENNLQSSSQKISDESFRMKALVEENQRLKAVVKEMRSDIESLQFQVVDSSKVGDIGGSSGENERVRSLEKRLEQTIGEVARLRKERTRLMDIGNELRSALYKKEIELLETCDNSNNTNDGKSARGPKQAWKAGRIDNKCDNKDDAVNHSSDDSKDADGTNIKTNDVLHFSDSSTKENDFSNSLQTKSITISKLPGKTDRSLTNYSNNNSNNNNGSSKMAVSGKARQTVAKAPRKVMNYAMAAKDTAESD
jgi:hypothetical protein